MAFDWMETTIGHQVTLQRGLDITRAQQRKGDIPVVSSGGATSTHDTPGAKGPGVVLGRKGVVGSVYFVVGDYWPHDTTLWVRDFKGNLPRFVYYFFKAHSNTLASLDVGSANPTLNRNHVHPISVLWPPISAQREISAVLGSLDDRIDLLRQTNTTLEAIAQALFKSWSVDFDPVHAKAEGREPEAMDAATAALFPSEFEESELGPIPKGWRVMPLLDACDLQGGTQPPASTFIDEPKAGYVRLLQIRDFSTDAHLTYIPKSKKLRTAQVDDILIGRYGSASGNKQKDSLGRICRGLEGAYNVALMKLVPGSVGREFAFQVFNDQNFYNYLQGVSAKAVQSGFSKKELALYKIVVPDDQVLERYESMGSAVWQQVKLKRKQMATLAQLRDTLLPRLISGKLRLPEATEAAEDALA